MNGHSSQAGFAHTQLVSGSGLVAALRRPGMIAILWLAALAHLLTTASELPGRFERFDFSIYYASALALRANLDPYTIDLVRVGAPLGLEIAPIEHATDPPAFLMCIEPLAALRPRAAYRLWQAVNFVALLAALWLLLGPASGIDARLALALCALALLYPPAGDNFFWAQNKIPVLLMLVLMMRWMQRGRDCAAGLILALAGLWRGFPLLLVGYLMLARRWCALACALAGVAAGAILTIAIVGAPVLLSFLSAGMREVTMQRFLAEPINLALPAFVSQTFWYAAAALGAKAGAGFDALRLSAVALAEVSLLALTVKATAGVAAGDRDSRAFALWVVASVLLAPTAWVHYLVLLLLPFAAIATAASCGRASRRAIWMAVASFLAIAISMDVRARFAPHSTSPVFIAAAEGGFISLMMAYVSAYWFVTDPV